MSKDKAKEVLNEEASKLEALKLIADNMEVGYHPKIGLEKLQAKIDANKVVLVKGPASQAVHRAELVKEATRLVRVRVVNMNPHRKDWTGDYYSVSNSVVGTIKKFVQFDVPWHIPHFIYKMLKAKKFRQSYDVPDGKGGKIRKNRFVPEFAIEDLPDLTQVELDALAKDQTARGAIDKD